MKTAILIAALFVSTQLSATETSTASQITSIKQLPVNPQFLFVRGHKQGQGYSLQWSMDNNAGIQNFVVEFTYEDPTDPYSNWYVAGQVNNSNSNIFKFIDMGVLPGNIAYRVVAILANNGGAVVSNLYCCTIGQ